MEQVEIIRFEKCADGRFRIGFDTGVTCLVYSGECQKMHLKEHGILTEAEYRQLLYEVIGKRAKKRALHILEQMDRTEMQLRQKLQRNEYPEICIDSAIEYVKQYHYLDDFRYACNYVRCTQEKKSRQRIRQDLMGKGVSYMLIESALEEEYVSSEQQKIQELLQKRNYSKECSDEREFRRTYQFLLRRGFRSSDIFSGLYCLTEVNKKDRI